MAETLSIDERRNKILQDLKNDPSYKIGNLQSRVNRSVNDIIRTLTNHSGDFTGEEIGNTLCTLNLFPGLIIPDTSRVVPFEEIARCLSKTTYTKLFLKIASALFVQPSDEILYDEQSQAAFNLYELCSGFLNYSDKCSAIGEQFGQIGGISLLLTFAHALDGTINWSDTRSFSGRRNIRLEFFQKIFAILHNCTRHHNQDNRHLYREANAVAFLEAKTSCPDVAIRIDAVLILAHIADEQMTQRVRPHLDCVLLVVELLRRAVESRIGAIRVTCASTESSDYYYSALELADALLHLAVNDDNKVAIFECDGIPIILRMLQRQFSDDEYLIALYLIRCLVFMEDIRNDQRILNMKPLLELMVESGGFNLREIATQILWEISNYEMVLPAYEPDATDTTQLPYYLLAPVEPETTARCIKLSFQQDWKHRYRALFIRDKLMQAGYNVWINEYPVRHRNHAEQTSVLKRSEALLVCVNEEYKERARCRAEVSYAKKLGIPLIPLLMESEYQPDGWLEKALDNTNYHRLCTAEDIDNNLQGLIEELGDRGRIRGPRETRFRVTMSKLKTALVSSRNEDGSSLSPDEPFHSASERYVRYWSSSRVNIWLKENGLDDRICFPGHICQGNQLIQMYKHGRSDMVRFAKECKKDFKIDGHIFHTFILALNKLIMLMQ